MNLAVCEFVVWAIVVWAIVSGQLSCEQLSVSSCHWGIVMWAIDVGMWAVVQWLILEKCEGEQLTGVVKRQWAIVRATDAFLSGQWSCEQLSGVLTRWAIDLWAIDREPELGVHLSSSIALRVLPFEYCPFRVLSLYDVIFGSNTRKSLEINFFGYCPSEAILEKI